ncbi:MAG: sodium:alanine symporter family protein [Gemmatimonadota bacterium]|nr:sodium:alanine symporter family protein [Gemmatimonadota bacterium]
MTDILTGIQGSVWGIPLIALLLFTGFNYTVLLRGIQFRGLGRGIWLAFVRRREEGGEREGDVSHYQALMTALAATVGIGNIVGVATALVAGGPGALFWMWVAGLLGMATKYAEAVLGVRFRETDQRGEKAGGPMYYLEHGLGGGKLGRGLAVAFAVFATLASFGIGNAVQSQAVASAINDSFGIAEWIVGIVVALGVGAVIIGGIKTIGRFAGVFVPSMILLYAGGAGLVLILNADQVPVAFRLVFENAFGSRAAAGGALGYTMLQAARFGVARGMFSNQSGLGSSAIAAAAAQTREPVSQALVSMIGTFIDTIVVSTFTGLAILATGALESGRDGANMTQLAFEAGLPGGVGGIFVALALTLFGFSTIIGWSYYGERSLAYLGGERTIRWYRFVFVLVVAASAVVELDVVWLVSDILNALMAAPNLLGLLLLSGIVRRETRLYFSKRKSATGGGSGRAVSR